MTTLNKKLLFIVNVDWFFVSHRLPIAIAAKNEGYEVHIAAFFTDKLVELKDYGFRLHKMHDIRKNNNFLNSLKYLIQIILLLKNLSPSIVHLITIKPILFGSLALKLFPNIYRVISISGLGYVFSSSGFFSKFRRIIVINLYKISLNNSRQTVIVQNNNDLSFLKKILKIKNNGFVFIPGSGVDLNLYKPKPKENKEIVFLFASRLLVSKGIREFASAAKTLPNAKFLIAGSFDKDNPECISEEEMFDWTRNGSLEYLGFREDINEIINYCSVVVLPSYYGEGLPKILIEASACGKPIITTYNPGCKEAIEENVTGLLVKEKNINDLIFAMRKFMNDPSLIKSMGLNARIRAEKLFDIDYVVRKHLEIYTNSYKG